ncbi:MAG: FmdB family zinc ribbon protein [Gammaproteobacteria bacterium]
MPIYEYQCDACGERLEVMQKISEKPLKQCPRCLEQALRKLVSAAAFRLKGSGWYATDFKDKKARKNAGGSEDAAPDKAETKTGTKESTPAQAESSKPETKGAKAAKTEKSPTKAADDT